MGARIKIYLLTFFIAASCSLGVAMEKPANSTAGPRGLHLPEGRTQVAVPIHRGGNLLFADVKINGKDAGFFMLDTGAVLNIIDPAMAAKLGLVGGNETGVAVGVGGAQRGKYLEVASLRLGDADHFVTLGRHTMTAMDVGHLKRLFGERFSGLLGTPLWEKLPYTIDYQRSRLVFYDREKFSPPDGIPPVKLTMADGWPTVPAAINERHTGRLLLDTGHEGGLDAAYAFVAKHRELFGAGRPQGISQGLGGQRADASARLKQLQMFGQEFADVPATFRASPHPGGNQPSAELGLVGGFHLRHFQLTMDYREGRAWPRWQPDDPLRGGEAKPAELNRIDYAGMTALTTAMRNRELRTCQALLKAGADPNLADRRHQATPLLLAIDLGMPAMVEPLLEAGADPNKSVAAETPLMIAAAQGRVDVAKKLLDAGADVNRQRPDGATALMLACIEKQAAAAQRLIEQGAKVNLATRSGATALMMAAEKGNVELVRALIAAKANVNTGNRGGLTPLILATTNGHAAASLELVKAKADVAARRFDGVTALHGAAEHNLQDVVKALLAADADVNVKNRAGLTPLDAAAKHNDARLNELLRIGEQRETSLLVIPPGRDTVDVSLHRGGNLWPFVFVKTSNN